MKSQNNHIKLDLKQLKKKNYFSSILLDFNPKSCLIGKNKNLPKLAANCVATGPCDPCH